MIRIFVDGDACPVKDEIYVVATRYGVPVDLVANARMFVPDGFGVEMVVVAEGPDAADDWIAEHVHASDVVVTADIPLAARCLEAGALVLLDDANRADLEGTWLDMWQRQYGASLVVERFPGFHRGLALLMKLDGATRPVGAATLARHVRVGLRHSALMMAHRARARFRAG